MDHLLLRPLAASDGVTRQDAVYGQLCDALMIGAFRPGEALSTRAIAESLGVSPMPVKDALRRLAGEGVLQARPQSAFVVETLTAKRFMDIIEARVRLETLAAGEAATRASDPLLARLNALNEEYRTAPAAEPVRGRLLKVNFDFHFSIYEASMMPDVCAIILKAWLRSGAVFSLIEAQLDPHEDFGKHLRIINAIADRDARATARMLEADIRETARRIGPLLPN